jgi:hypothetical protein
MMMGEKTVNRTKSVGEPTKFNDDAGKTHNCSAISAILGVSQGIDTFALAQLPARRIVLWAAILAGSLAVDTLRCADDARLEREVAEAPLCAGAVSKPVLGLVFFVRLDASRGRCS